MVTLTYLLIQASQIIIRKLYHLETHFKIKNHIKSSIYKYMIEQRAT